MATVLGDILSFPRESAVLAIAETTFATEVKPTASSGVPSIGEIQVSQPLGFVPDPQRRLTYSPRPDIPGRYDPGVIQGLQMLIKPRAVGTAPDGGVLLKTFWGRETIVGGTSVTYSPLRMIDTRPSATVWVRDGHAVYRCLGTLLNQADLPIRADNSPEALHQVGLAGTFAELRWTGTDELAVAIPSTGGGGVTTMTLKSAKKYTINSYVEIGALTNAGAGYQITAVDYGTNVVTFTPAIVSIAVAVDSLVKPWWPTTSENGTIIHGRKGIATRGGSNLSVMSGSIQYGFPVKLLNAEKNGLDFANRFSSPALRDLQCNLEVLFDANAGRYWYDVKTGVLADVICPWGTVSGERSTLTVKNHLVKGNPVTGNEERIMALNGNGYASSSFDDECVLVLD